MGNLIMKPVVGSWSQYWTTGLRASKKTNGIGVTLKISSDGAQGVGSFLCLDGRS